jgi:hypothetical protein
MDGTENIDVVETNDTGISLQNLGKIIDDEDNIADIDDEIEEIEEVDNKINEEIIRNTPPSAFEKKLVNEIHTKNTNVVPNEDAVERRLRYIIIGRYRMSRRFAKYLVLDMGFNLSIEHLKTLTIAQMDQLIDEIRFVISCKNVGNFWEDAATEGIKMIEPIISKYTPYNVMGTSILLASNEKYLDYVEEMVLENQHYTYTKPQYRMMYEVIKTFQTAHQTHTHMAHLASTAEGREQIREMGSVINKNGVGRDENGLIKSSDPKTDAEIKSNYENMGMTQKNVTRNFEKKYSDLLDD